ncbi:type II CAAX prenyl endopeptidase Rce1 family protein [Pseudarthrobacter sp. NamB4]|uniref:CPBP family glutamic-type intramembrane protease n=1 Tax=Pseudarthrobacter sp. NamB4 TaxID=2576837 RepID=UPI0010FD2CC2|nr:CPBP family glutamic-type intramembrane protease [Pseudarthrobacter sp. NamB4]TLM71357.1 CPBP family intramembrane metalloprotease [Pseudarthrobacter sp. NamB4]
MPATHPLSLVPAALVSASGFLLFARQDRLSGFLLLAVALVLAGFLSRRLLVDLALIAVGLTAMSLVPITTDISTEHMLVMGTAMIIAVGVPYSVSRFITKDHAIRFPVRTGQPWTRAEKWYLPAVLVIGYALMPVYMIRTGVYNNWPAVSDPDGIARLFLGTNVLGIWDELFFICTAFTLLRRHLPDWQANLLQAVLFTSFLWELGFHAWAPFFIFPFALLQARLFTVTKSLSYIVSVHLLFDFVLFLVLIHAHNRQWIDIFLY